MPAMMQSGGLATAAANPERSLAALGMTIKSTTAGQRHTCGARCETSSLLWLRMMAWGCRKLSP